MIPVLPNTEWKRIVNWLLSIQYCCPFPLEKEGSREGRDRELCNTAQQTGTTAEGSRLGRLGPVWGDEYGAGRTWPRWLPKNHEASSQKEGTSWASSSPQGQVWNMELRVSPFLVFFFFFSLLLIWDYLCFFSWLTWNTFRSESLLIISKVLDTKLQPVGQGKMEPRLV